MALTPFPTNEKKSGLTPFPSLDTPSEQPAPKTPYSELSAWDLAKAGDIDGLLGRVFQGTQTNMADSFANVGSEENANGFLNNAGRELTEWGNTVGQDVGNLMDARGASEIAGAAGDLYSDAIARPAGMAAVTPFLPAQLRAAAGAVYLPKFAHDVVSTYEGNRSGEATGEEQGALEAAGSTIKQIVVDPLTGLASTLYNNPGELADRIYENPSALWDEVLAPVSIVEAPARAGKWAYDKMGKKVEEFNPEEGFVHAPDKAELMSDFDAWFEGMAEQESGGNYDARNADTWASGRYQIMPENWEPWAEEAGLGRDAEFTPENQDAVARFKMKQYYDQYGPEGALVAWYAGPANAERWAAGEITDVWGREWNEAQSNGPSIAEYVESSMGHAKDKGYGEGSGLMPAREVDLSDIPIQDIEDAGLANTNNTAKYHFRNLYDWARQEFGKEMEISGGWRSPEHNAEVNGSPTSHHLHGNAIDVNLSMFTEAEREAIFQKAREMGFNKGGDDMYHDKGSGLHGHFVYEDEGIPNGVTRQPRAQSTQMRAGEPRQAEPEPQGGELTDMFGRDFSNNENYIGDVVRMGREAEVENAVSSLERGWDRERSNLDDLVKVREAVAQEIQDMVDAEIGRYEGNPGGKGTNTSLIYDGGIDERGRGQGNVVGRVTESNNPQWYRDFYKEHGRPPKKSEYGEIAWNNLMKQEEFAHLDRALRRMDAYREEIEKNPRTDINKIMDEVDSRIKYELEGKKRVNPMSEKDINNLIDRGRQFDEIKKGESVSERGEGFDSSAPTASGPTLRASQRRNESPVGPSIPQEASNIHSEIAKDVENEISYSLQSGASRQGGQGVSRTAPNLGSGKPKGAYNEQTVTRRNIFDRARELFGTIRTGRTPKGAEGFYNGASEVARTKSYGDWDTMWHEIGHKLDDSLDLGNYDHAEAQAAMQRKYGNNIPYKPNEIPAEGAAEFVKEYMNDPQQARRLFPTLSREFERKLAGNQDIASRVREMQGMMKADREQPLGAKIAGTIHEEAPKTFKDKVNDFLHTFMQKFVDDKHGLRTAERELEKITGHELTPDESAYVYARIAKDRGISAANLILTGEDPVAVQKALNKLYGGVVSHAVTLPEIVKKLEALEKNNPDWLKSQGLKDYSRALSAYTVARRFMEVHDLMTKKTGKEYRMPLDYKQYKEFVDNAPKELKEAAQGVYDLNENVVDIMHHEGILSDAVHKALKRDHQHYVSLARDFPDDAAIRAGSFAPSGSFVNVGTPLKRLSEEGSFRDVKDPMKMLGRNIYKSLSLVERNKVGRKLADQSGLQGAGGVVEKVSGQAKTTDSTFYVWRNGKKEVYQTTPEIYQALKSLKPEGSDQLIGFMAKTASAMRAGAVVYNASFLLKNAMRDQTTAYLLSEYGYKPIIDFAKGVAHLLNKDDMYHEFMSSGAVMSTFQNADRNIAYEFLKDAQKTKARKVFDAVNPLANLARLNDFIEKSTRLGLYSNARRKGASIIEATMEAREGTIDFGKAGTVGRSINRYSPFFNAAVQDPVLFVEKFKKNPKRMMLRLAPMVFGSLALYALIRSNDETSQEYDQMLPYEKNMFWNIPVPKSIVDTGWVRVPKPFGPGLLFASFPERIADTLMGHDKGKKAMKAWARSFSETFRPGSMPPLLTAAFEWNSGYNNFLDRDIVPAREKNLRPEDQYGPDTSEFAKAAGKQLGLSPRKIDNLGNNLFAGAYRDTNNLIDFGLGKKDFKSNPLETLKVDPWKSPQTTQDYYDRKTEVTQAYNSYKQKGTPVDLEDLRDYKRIASIDKGMKKFNQQIRKAQEEGDDAEYRRLKKAQAQFLESAMEKLDRR